MKDIRPALRSLLLSDATVFSLVGGLRIYPLRMPQGVRASSIVYNRVNENSDYAMDGDTGLETAWMQIDSWATSQDASVELANAAWDILTGFRGQVDFGAASPQDFVIIHGIFQFNGREDYDSDAELYRMSREYSIWYAGR